jgi:hypothetical protein
MDLCTHFTQNEYDQKNLLFHYKHFVNTKFEMIWKTYLCNQYNKL